MRGGGADVTIASRATVIASREPRPRHKLPRCGFSYLGGHLEPFLDDGTLPMRNSRIGVVTVLVVLIAGVLVVGGDASPTIVTLTVLATLLASEFDRSAYRLAVVVLRIAACLLPHERRNDELDEWVDHAHAAGDHGLSPLLVALSIVIRSVPTMILGVWTRHVLDRRLATRTWGALFGSAWNKHIAIYGRRRVGFRWIERSYVLSISLHGDLSLKVEAQSDAGTRHRRIADWVGWGFLDTSLEQELSRAVQGNLRGFAVKTEELAGLLKSARADSRRRDIRDPRLR
jgi:hypothetical protein